MLNTYINVCTLVCVCSILQYFSEPNTLLPSYNTTYTCVCVCVFRLHCVCVCLCVCACECKECKLQQGQSENMNEYTLTWLCEYSYMHVRMYLCHSRALIIKKSWFWLRNGQPKFAELHTYKHMYILCTYLCMVMNDRQFNKKNQIKSNVFLVYTANNCC